MLPIYLLVAAAVLASTPAHAQDQVEQQTTQQSDPVPAPAPERLAVPRGEAPREVRGARSRSERSEPAPGRAEPAPRLEASPPSAPRVEASQAAEGQRQAVPRGGRPRGDNPPVGQAVPRGEQQAPPPVSPGDRGGVRDRDRDRNIIVRRPPVYNNYYYYPRSYYPYGYGGFGLGYFYYDPYAWYPRSYGYRSYGYGAGPGFYGGVFRSGRYYGGSYFDHGELRLDVSPRYAQVFVDGYYAGIVDDYDGILQSLKMEEGPYHIEIVAPGFETLEFDVRINRGQKIRYRGDLIRIRP